MPRSKHALFPAKTTAPSLLTAVNQWAVTGELRCRGRRFQVTAVFYQLFSLLDCLTVFVNGIEAGVSDVLQGSRWRKAAAKWPTLSRYRLIKLLGNLNPLDSE